MRRITNRNRNDRSVRAKLAGALTFGFASMVLVSGLALVSASSASAATSAPITLPSTSVGANYTSSTFTEPTAGTWAVSAGALPPGLALTSLAAATTDTISGTPTSDGTYDFTITVTDTVTPATYSQAYVLTVTGIGPNTLTTPILVNSAYKSTTLTTATAGTWAITSGALPTGLALTSAASSTTDTISGTPTVNGTYNFTVTVSDSTTPATYVQAYTLVVASQIPQPKFSLLPTVAALEHPIALITTGGAGINTPTFAVTNGTATGCSITGTTLTATTTGTCLVTASEASSPTFLAATAGPVTFTFVANPPPPAVLKATHVKGTAVIGKTVTLTIAGANFSGKPTIKSSNPGTRVAVTRDTGKSLTVKVTASAKAHKGAGTLTITEGSGKSVKIRYVTA
jgi:large repetitive protein